MTDTLTIEELRYQESKESGRCSILEPSEKMGRGDQTVPTTHISLHLRLFLLYIWCQTEFLEILKIKFALSAMTVRCLKFVKQDSDDTGSQVILSI